MICTKDNKDYRYCQRCKRVLPPSFKGEFCSVCQETELFAQVRDYVRENNVTEYQVAEHFQISVHLVKRWIREGRIEYRDVREARIMANYCAHCGVQVNFGSLCPKCLRLMNGDPRGFGYAPNQPSEEEGKMRFLDQDED
ncbi:MAG: hypothetical protein MR355_07555 [Lachnospiraceae bacterium]|nr:hypothetical protein [Lachnospiraceae bacterium]